MTPLILNNPETAPITDEQFYQICVANRELKLERTAKGYLIIIPPTRGTTGNRNFKLAQQLANLMVIFSPFCFNIARN
jgi:Uma2 family endonuclease